MLTSVRVLHGDVSLHFPPSSKDIVKEHHHPKSLPTDIGPAPTAQTLTTTGRPPWTGNTTQCLLSQYNNALYVLGGDASDLTKIYIYDFGGSSWSTQTTSSPPPNLGSRSASVLDHDTNVIFTLPTGSGASLYQLDLGNVKASASGSAIGWEAVEAPSFSMDGYTPTAAEASNHISGSWSSLVFVLFPMVRVEL